ncbi:MAG: DHHW family protein [Candidatus Ornithomonoglobus sp.]
MKYTNDEKLSFLEEKEEKLDEFLEEKRKQLGTAASKAFKRMQKKLSRERLTDLMYNLIEEDYIGDIGRRIKSRITALISDADNVIAVCTVIALAATAAAVIFHSPRSISEKENRELAQFPEVSWTTILDGSFMDSFETYVSDQFRWRDSAVSLKADSERMMGKKGSNGVHFGKDSCLIARPSGFNQEIVDSNIEAIKRIENMGGYKMTVAVVPTAFEVQQDKLPAFTYDKRIFDVTNELWKQFDAESGVDVCDPTAILKEHKDEYIYYRTDHHQTALGSYYLYTALAPYLEYEPYPLDAFNVIPLSKDFYGTSWSKASLTFQKPDEIDAYYLNQRDIVANVSYPLENKEWQSLYAMDNLKTKDKYAVYIDGNHGLTVINTNAGTGKSIAVLKDSYAHSLAPFLANNFDSIHLIDMRYYSGDLIRYLGENGVTDMLILYNAETFCEDTNLTTAAELAEATDYYELPPCGWLDWQDPVDASYFNDAVFFGDSLTYGHSYYSTLPAQFVCKSSMSTWTVDEFTGADGRSLMQTLLDLTDVNKYYLMLGVNELAFQQPDTYADNFRSIINRIREVNPTALIYLQSVLPIESKAEGILTNAKIRQGNEILCSLAEEMGCYYLDIYNYLLDGTGYLPAGSASDGIHFGASQNELWDSYLIYHAVVDKRPKNAQVKTFTLYTGGGAADVEAFANEMLAGVGFTDTLSPASETVSGRLFGLEENSLLQGCVYASGGSTAEEFALFEAASPEAAQEVAQKLAAQVEDRKPDFESYKPEEMPKLNNPVIVVNGNVAMLCVTDNADAARAIMEKY